MNVSVKVRKPIELQENINPQESKASASLLHRFELLPLVPENEQRIENP